MSNKTTEQKVDELLDRSIRTESRLVQLGDHVGANLRIKQRIDIHRLPAGLVEVDIDSLDVSISRIYTELGTDHPGKEVKVFLNGVHVATVYPQ